MWATFIELVRGAVFAGAHVCGGNVGWGVMLVSFALRLALLPLTLRVQRRARDAQERLARLKPELARIEKRFAKRPELVARETMALYKRNGVRLVDPVSWVAMGVQAPAFLALNSVVRSGLGAGVRWLWVADLARPDKLLALAASLLVGLSIWAASRGAGAPAGVSASQAAMLQRVQLIIAIGSTLAFLIVSPSLMSLSVVGGVVGGGASALRFRRGRR